MGWSAGTAIRMAKRYAYIGQKAMRDAMEEMPRSHPRCFAFALPHLAFAALLAISLRSAGVSFLARALDPGLFHWIAMFNDWSDSSI
jgi:hypothetical protein